jgi:hypothetical protein
MAGGQPGQQAGDDERPQDVELFLDAQRPRVLQRRRGGGGRDVPGAAPDHPPVRHVRDRGEPVAAEQLEVVAVEQVVTGDRGSEQHGQQGRHQPARTPSPEPAEFDATVAYVLGEQQ